MKNLRLGVLQKAAKKYRPAAEKMFLICYAWDVFFAFLDTTTISSIWKSEVLNPFRLVLLGLTCAGMLCRGKWTKKEVLFSLLVMAGFGGSYLVFHRRFVLDTGILIVAARGIDFKRILKVYLASAMSALILSVVLSQAGISADLVFRTDRALGSIRHAFGSIYATDFCAHLLFLSCAAVLVVCREQKMIWCIVLILEGVVSFCMCGAFTAVGCFVLLLIVYLLSFQLQKEGWKTVKKKLAWLILLPPVSAGVMILLSAMYDENIPWMKMLDHLLHSRLHNGRMGFDRYPVRWFGQYVKLVGNGGAEMDLKEEYFFLDCSYVYTLICHGIVLLAAVLVILCAVLYRAWKAEAWLLFGVLLVVCADSFMEHHLTDLSYNPFLLMVLADLSWIQEKEA